MSFEKIEKSKEEIESILKETEGVLNELDNTLSTVEVVITKKSPKVIQAISALFGPNFIRSDGTAVITYKMYQQVNKMLRVSGKAKVQEYL